VRYLVISDIHANLEALTAVLSAAPAHDHVLMLGDLVGYGADPNAVIDVVRRLPAATHIRGNHDKVAAGLATTDGFNYLAKHAVSWTATALTPEHHAWLSALPEGPRVVDELIEICHGAPFDEDTYIFDDLDAVRGLCALTRPVCLFGHTHVPAAYGLTHELQHLTPPRGSNTTITFEVGTRYLVNCGAVGQPRDGDPRAAFGLLDTAAGTIDLLRVGYDIAGAQAKIIDAGLPDVLAQRLAAGR
jgi:diadenosine tetraphosphatase ApaH/serine/threonine PP2A family protein phosphatase